MSLVLLVIRFIVFISSVAVSRNELQAKLASLSTSQSASSTEVETLRHRVEDVEREKRDLMGVVSRLKEDSTQRDGQFPALTQFQLSLNIIYL